MAEDLPDLEQEKFEASMKDNSTIVRVRIEIEGEVYGIAHALQAGFPLRHHDEELVVGREALSLGGKVAQAFFRHFLSPKTDETPDGVLKPEE